MRIKMAVVVILMFVFAGSAYSVGAEFNNDMLEKVRIQAEDIPNGFIYGTIPDFAKTVLKNNPWNFDRSAINRLSKNIYPGGNADMIKGIHMTILARKDQPLGDDIVCYIFLYRDAEAARKETEKLHDYVKYNSDRAIVFQKNNVAVFIHADDVGDYDLIKVLSEKMEVRLNQ